MSDSVESGTSVASLSENQEGVNATPQQSSAVADPSLEQGKKKYNSFSMTDDGPPPPAVLSAIQKGFSFSRHVNPQVKSGDLCGRVVDPSN